LTNLVSNKPKNTTASKSRIKTNFHEDTEFITIDNDEKENSMVSNDKRSSNKRVRWSTTKEQHNPATPSKRRKSSGTNHNPLNTPRKNMGRSTSVSLNKNNPRVWQNRQGMNNSLNRPVQNNSLNRPVQNNSLNRPVRNTSESSTPLTPFQQRNERNNGNTMRNNNVMRNVARNDNVMRNHPQHYNNNTWLGSVRPQGGKSVNNNIDRDRQRYL
ncbi:hypothetical protein SNEBB_001027, partial [Seison nebaliae]